MRWPHRKPDPIAELQREMKRTVVRLKELRAQSLEIEQKQEYLEAQFIELRLEAEAAVTRALQRIERFLETPYGKIAAQVPEMARIIQHTRQAFQELRLY